jgi:hypothetical protein
MNGKQMEGARHRRSGEEVERLVKEFETSGLGRQAFCKKHGLSLSTLNRHRKRKQLRLEAATGGRLLPVEIMETKQANEIQSRGELLVWLTNGRRIEVRGGFDANALEQLVRVLERA